MIEIEWLYAKCPECGREYSYIKDYKPQTCGRFECLHKHLHPELHKNTGLEIYKREVK